MATFKIVAKCKKCNKVRTFESFNELGYCKKCSEEYEQHLRWLQDQEEIKQRKAQQEKKRYEEIKRIHAVDVTLSSEKRKRQSGFESPKYSNITPKGNYASFVVIDTETTGLAPSSDRIIEIGAVKFQNGKPIETFNTLINPGRPIPEESINIHHITDDMVKDSPKVSQVLKAFEDFIDCPVVIGHNLEFDLKFLFYSGSTILEKKCKFIDTLDQAHRLIKKSEVESYKLVDLCDYFRIKMGTGHRSLSDAMATGELFLELVGEVQNG